MASYDYKVRLTWRGDAGKGVEMANTCYAASFIAEGEEHLSDEDFEIQLGIPALGEKGKLLVAAIKNNIQSGREDDDYDHPKEIFEGEPTMKISWEETKNNPCYMLEPIWKAYPELDFRLEVYNEVADEMARYLYKNGALAEDEWEEFEARGIDNWEKYNNELSDFLNGGRGIENQTKAPLVFGKEQAKEFLNGTWKDRNGVTMIFNVDDTHEYKSSESHYKATIEEIVVSNNEGKGYPIKVHFTFCITEVYYTSKFIIMVGTEENGDYYLNIDKTIIMNSGNIFKKCEALPATPEEIKKMFFSTWIEEDGAKSTFSDDIYEFQSSTLHYKAYIVSWVITKNKERNNLEYPVAVELTLKVSEAFLGSFKVGDAFSGIYYINTDKIAICDEYKQILKKLESKPAQAAKAPTSPDSDDSELLTAKQWFELGVSLGKEENFEKSIEAFNNALNLDPGKKTVITKNLVVSLQKLFNKCYENGDFDGAINACNDLLSHNSDDSQVYKMLAYCYCRNGDNAIALETINKAIKLEPTNANCWDTRAEIYEAMGEFEKAIADCKKALELDPELETSKEILERCQKALRPAKPTPSPKPAPTAKAPPAGSASGGCGGDLS